MQYFHIINCQTTIFTAFVQFLPSIDKSLLIVYMMYQISMVDSVLFSYQLLLFSFLTIFSHIYSYFIHLVHFNSRFISSFIAFSSPFFTNMNISISINHFYSCICTSTLHHFLNRLQSTNQFFIMFSFTFSISYSSST